MAARRALAVASLLQVTFLVLIVVAIVRALDGRFIAPAPGGDLMRTTEILPTGRNLHGFDGPVAVLMAGQDEVHAESGMVEGKPMQVEHLRERTEDPLPIDGQSFAQRAVDPLQPLLQLNHLFSNCLLRAH